MTKELKDFEDVQMWKGLKQLAKEIYEGFVSCNDYSFVDQIKRTSVSSNVAEGAERGTSTEFARFLDIAKGSCGEVRSMLRLAGELDYLKEVDADKLAQDCIKISKQFGGFSKYLRNKSLALK